MYVKGEFYHMLFNKIIKMFGGLWNVRKKAKNSKISLFYKVLYAINLDKQNAYIPLSVRFESLAHFPHGIAGIFISSDSVIGKNAVIFHQVTIGSNNIPDSKGNGAPKIGDNCYIGTGAKIIGNVVIGDNVRIGANCVVFKDVPSNSVVVNPAPRIISKENANNKFYSRKKDDWGYYENGDWIEENDEEILGNLKVRSQ